MEREFLLGVGFCLFVDETTYNSWLSLLKGLVLAKEREHLRWRSGAIQLPPIQKTFSSRNGGAYSARQGRPQAAQGQRARSSSPHRPRSYSYAPAYPFTFAVPSQARALEGATASQSLQASPVDKLGDRAYHNGKRTAADAFSPTSTSFPQRASKRPTGLAVDINAALASAQSHASANGNRHYSRYADSLHGLERMSLGAPTPVDTQSQAQRAPAHTLAAEYRGADAVQRAVPQHLYFYTLASSPVRGVRAEDGSAPSSTKQAEVNETYYPHGAERKAKLRYTHPSTDYSYGYAQNAAPNAYVPSYGQQTSVSGAANPALAYPTPAAVARQYSQPNARVQEEFSQRSHNNNLPPLTVALSQPEQASSATYAQPAQSGLHANYVDALSARSSISASPVNSSSLPCGCAAEAAYCTPPTSGSSYPSHLPPCASNYHHHPSHLHVPGAQAAPSIAAMPSHHLSPVATRSLATYHQHQHQHQPTPGYTAPRGGAQPQPAAFANAGPPGVASHFYQCSPLPGSYGGHAASAGAGAVVATHSVDASPSAWAYAGRGRRL